jgi:hypothetical protein
MKERVMVLLACSACFGNVDHRVVVLQDCTAMVYRSLKLQQDGVACHVAHSLPVTCRARSIVVFHPRASRIAHPLASQDPYMQALSARVASFSPPSPPKSSRKRRAQTPRLPWPHPPSFRATPQSLAEAGFYHRPSEQDPDNVSCFMCDKQLSEWEEEDDPRAVHVQKCPDCPWVMVYCTSVDWKDQSGM